MMMGVNDQISSQGFGYGKREECKELMVFDSHNKILNTLKWVLHCINRGNYEYLYWEEAGTAGNPNN